MAGVREPSVATIEQSLADAEKLTVAGDLNLSYVQSWAALEAAMCDAARTAGIEIENYTTAFLLRALYARGMLQKADFQQLNDTLKIRNALIEGLVVSNVSASASQSIVNVARKLLSVNGEPVAS